MSTSSFSFSNTLPPTATTGSNGPFLLPPVTVGTPVYTNPLLVYVGSVCAPNTSISTKGISSSDNPVFSLSFKQGTYSGSQFFALVSVVAASVYSQDPAVRAEMATAFSLFRQQVEGLEVTQATAATGGLLQGSAATLLNRVALSLPLRLDEVLPYLYGFNPTSQYVDLQPGMSLRIEWAGYQYCAPPGGPGFGFNSFANTGASRLRIVRRPDLTLAPDAFMGAFQPGYELEPAASCPLLAAGPLDLCVSGNARRHLRIILPSPLAGSSALDNGGAQQQLSAWLVGADSYADLEAATKDILNSGTGCGKQAQGHNPIVSISFTSRVILVPEISVLLNGNPVVVPLGTTVRNLVAEYADPAPDQYMSSSYVGSNLNLGMNRWLQNTGNPSAPATNIYYQANFIFLPTNTIAPPVYAGTCGDQYDLPLIKGDSVTLAIR